MTAHASAGCVAGLVAAGGLFFLGVSLQGAPVARKAITHTVTIEGTRYQPSDLAVRVGDSIVWNNKDLFPHTVTSKSGGFDSRAIAAGASWTYTPTSRREAT